MKTSTAVATPSKDTEDKAALIEALRNLEQWGRYNDRHVRMLCIEALRKVDAWEN